MDFKNRPSYSLISISIFIIALSVGYYFLVALPKIENQKVEVLKAQEQVIAVEKAQAEIARQENKINRDNCVNDVRNRLSGAMKKCDNCSLELANLLIKSFGEQEQNCFKQYPASN